IVLHSLVENTQFLTYLVRCRAPHERLQQLKSKFKLAAHLLQLVGAKVRLAPSCSIRHDASLW
ncbi:hypothetical protein BHM03_00061228, partial [Ensete ventricosum]